MFRYKLVTVKMVQGNLQQFLSSLLSEHPPLLPLHRKEGEIHWPLLHRNWVELQPRYIIYLARVNEGASIASKYELLFIYTQQRVHIYILGMTPYNYVACNVIARLFN